MEIKIMTREDFMNDVYHILDFLPTNNEANEIIDAEPDELPNDDYRYGMHRAFDIINKYIAESEN